MVQGEHDRLVVHHVEWMTEFPRVADAGHLSQVVPVNSEELDEMPGAPVGKAEDYAMLHAMLRRILSDASEDREPTLDGDPTAGGPDANYLSVQVSYGW
jgi:hypothetical protein